MRLEIERRAEAQKRRGEISAPLRLRAAFLATHALLTFGACAAAPSEVAAPPRPSEVASEPRPEPAPDPEPAPAGARGPWTEERTLESAAYDEPGAPSVVVHAPPAFDPARPLRLAIFLHGWTGCARVLVHAGATACKDGARPEEGWDLAGRVDEAGTDALLVVPQLAFMQRTGHPGRFLEPGRFRRFVEELLGALAPQLGPDKTLADVESVTLLAHSAGFETALAILARGELEVRNVVLFDALYRGVEPFGEWALARDDQGAQRSDGRPTPAAVRRCRDAVTQRSDPCGRRLVSLYTGAGRTAQQTRRLARLLEVPIHDERRSLATIARDARIVLARSPAPHGEVPARHIPELLGPIGLSTRQ